MTNVCKPEICEKFGSCRRSFSWLGQSVNESRLGIQARFGVCMCLVPMWTILWTLVIDFKTGTYSVSAVVIASTWQAVGPGSIPSQGRHGIFGVKTWLSILGLYIPS